MMISGTFAKSAHGKITRALLKDTGVVVVSQGSSFYNANRFSIVHFIFEFCKWVDRNQPDQITEEDVGYIWNQVRLTKGENKIVIASTPDQVSPEYLATLDGGILHEAFHSLYSLRGDLDTSKVFDAVSKTYVKGLPYGSKSGVLKSFMNIFEDSYIERRGFRDFDGAPYLIQRVHELVWQMEEGNRISDPIAEFMCALRDRVENYLTGAPFHSYTDDTLAILDTNFKDIIERGSTTDDPYEVLELAMETFARIFTPQEEVPEEEVPEEKVPPENGVPEESPDSFEESAPEGYSESPEALTEDSPESGANEPEEGANDSEETEGEDGGKDAFEVLQEAFSNSDAKELLDIKDVINDIFKDEPIGSDLSQALPWTREYDTVNFLPEADAHGRGEFAELARMARQESLYIRPRVVNFLRGTKKVRNHHGKEKGRRLSGRTLHEVVYKATPKPFVVRDIKETEDAAVSIVLDESGSMDCKTARQILTIFAVTFQDLKVPFEVIGFQDLGGGSSVNIPHEDRRVFTRATPRTFNVFRTFDEGFTDATLAKLMQTRASGGTPILDGLDFAGRRLLPRREKKKLLIVITDGEMGTDSVCLMSTRTLVDITNREIDLLEKHGVNTLMVGIGYGAGSVSKYQNSVHIPKIKDFSEVINEYILQNLLAK